MNKIKIAKAHITLIRGDISSEKCDCLVNAANNHFWMGSGVAGALKKAAGPKIEQEAMNQGPQKTGEIVISSAGKLDAKYIIHAAVMGQDLQTNEEIIRQAVKNSLIEAEKLGCKSMAFPAFGVGNFSPHICAKIMLEESIEFLLRAKSLLELRFVLFEEDIYNAFQKRLSYLFGHRP
ncbi:MAG TPA: Appr-1-p processing protein [Candidatus Marinimicrobia bacterium]|nr:Appr-1-p processing protein [Candidatus Neomarinimicrobiota bacterium]